MIDPKIHEAVRAGLALLPPAMTGRPALVMLYSIGFQESGMSTRRQFGNGPARGLWQFEQGGGVKGVLTHPGTAELAAQVCAAHHVPATPGAVWASLEGDDALAAAFARLLLWADPRSLPDVDDVEGGWQSYVWNWRPGKPRPAEWAHNHAQGLDAAQGSGLW